jgi:site-specific DNA-methyltransferase (adenine-specific)
MCNHDWIACGDEKICLLCGQVVKADEPTPSVTEKNRPINQVLHGNSLEVLKTLEDNSVDSIVTDPPYELGFMGKKWDSTGIAYNVELWKECLRVLKPGGHLLAFGGTRTYHRMACAIEDAGFEIRDCIQWLYGSGFPKSHDISKAIDKKLGAERKVVGKRVHPTLKNPPKVKSKAYHVESLDSDKSMESWDITAPATDESRYWDGWGTALKPANEPIVLARKPLSEKTIADNVLKWGTGGLNIDGCRIESGGEHKRAYQPTNHERGVYGKQTAFQPSNKEGRFPANVILDEEAGRMLDEQSGITKSGGTTTKGAKNNWGNPRTPLNNIPPSVGGASRFFYCAKASKKERNMGLEDMPEVISNDGRDETLASGNMPHNRGNVPKKNHHPTVKPIKLMGYLITLITPPNGIVLDPFFGSGTTGIAAVNLGFNYIGIELDEQYVEIARRRISAVEE